jgi:hypothetical protein
MTTMSSTNVKPFLCIPPPSPWFNGVIIVASAVLSIKNPGLDWQTRVMCALHVRFSVTRQSLTQDPRFCLANGSLTSPPTQCGGAPTSQWVCPFARNLKQVCHIREEFASYPPASSVTRTTSSAEVTPWSNLSIAPCRNVASPSLIAAARMSSTDAFLRTSCWISGVTFNSS